MNIKQNNKEVLFAILMFVGMVIFMAILAALLNH